mgnify:CR=1 FL=1
MKTGIREYPRGLVAAAACLGCAFFGVTMFFWGAMLPTLGETIQGVQNLPWILTLGIIAGTIICGAVMDRYGYKALLIVSSLALALGLCGFIFGHSLWLFVVSAFLIGAGGGVLNSETIAIISDIYGDSLRGTMLSILGASYCIGSLLWTVICRVWSYDPMIPMQWSAAVIAVLSLAFIFIPFPKAKLTKEDKFSLLDSIKLFRYHILAVAGFLFFFQGVLEAISANYSTSYYTGVENGVDKAVALTSLIFMTVGMAIGRFTLPLCLKVAGKKSFPGGKRLQSEHPVRLRADCCGQTGLRADAPRHRPGTLACEIAERTIRLQRSQRRSYTLGRTVCKRPEDDIRKRVEPASHPQHSGIHYAGIRHLENNCWKSIGHIHRCEQQGQLCAGIAAELAEVLLGRVQPLRRDVHKLPCQRNHVHDMGSLQQLRQQQSHKKVRPEKVDRKAHLQPVSGLGIVPADDPGIIEQSADRNTIHRRGELPYRFKRSQIQHPQPDFCIREILQDILAEHGSLLQVAACHNYRPALSGQRAYGRRAHASGGTCHNYATFHIQDGYYRPTEYCRQLP